MQRDPCRRQPHLLLINHSVSSYLQVHMYNYTVCSECQFLKAAVGEVANLFKIQKLVVLEGDG